MGMRHRFDVLLTHAVLNTIQAGYYGKLASITIAAELDGRPPPSQEVLGARGILEGVECLARRLFDGDPVLRRDRRAPPSREAATTWRVFVALKSELRQLAKRLEPFCREQAPARGKNAARFLVTALGRLAYGRQQYACGLERFDETIGQWYPPQLRQTGALQSANEVRRVRAYVQALRSREDLGGAFYRGLRQIALELPTAFRMQVHDMNLIVGFARGEVSYSIVDIDAGEAAHWMAIGVSAERAGYWNACGIAPEESVRWIAADFQRPEQAGVWASRGFTPEEAAGWDARGFDARTAMTWRDHGVHDPIEARRWRNRGFPDLQSALAWRTRGFDPPSARTWSFYFTAEEARDWRDKGFDGPMAARAQNQSMQQLSQNGFIRTHNKPITDRRVLADFAHAPPEPAVASTESRDQAEEPNRQHMQDTGEYLRATGERLGDAGDHLSTADDERDTSDFAAAASAIVEASKWKAEGSS